MFIQILCVSLQHDLYLNEKNMERPMITLDELMSMSEKEINEFIDRDEQLLAEGLIDENQPNIDLMGMSGEEIAQKYGYTPMNVVL